MAKVIKNFSKKQLAIKTLLFGALCSFTIFSYSKISYADVVKAKDSTLIVADSKSINSFDSTKDLLEENAKLKADRDNALAKYKELRDKYQKLHSFCERSETSCLNINSVKAKGPSEAMDLSFIRDEISKSKEVNRKLQEELEKLKKEAEQKSSDLKVALASVQKAKLDAESKKKAERACLDQIDQSSKLVLRIPELEKEIMSLNNQLLLKKTAADLLSQQRSATRQENKEVPNQEKQIAAKQVNNNVNTNTQSSVQASNINLNADVAVVEVTADKVSLRVGPGAEHSAIMDLQKGTRLTVEAREGSWLRVNSPTGGRAYINSEYVRVLGQKRQESVRNIQNTQGLESRQNSDMRRSAVDLKEPEPQVPSISRNKTNELMGGIRENKATSRGSLQRPARRAAAQEQDLESFGELKSADGSPEAVALEKLIKGMGQKPKGE